MREFEFFSWVLSRLIVIEDERKNQNTYLKWNISYQTVVLKNKATTSPWCCEKQFEWGCCCYISWKIKAFFSDFFSAKGIQNILSWNSHVKVDFIKTKLHTKQSSFHLNSHSLHFANRFVPTIALLFSKYWNKLLLSDKLTNSLFKSFLFIWFQFWFP